MTSSWWSRRYTGRRLSGKTIRYFQCLISMNLDENGLKPKRTAICHRNSATSRHFPFFQPFSSICKLILMNTSCILRLFLNWYKKPRDYWPKASQQLCFHFYWCNKYSVLILLLHYSVGHYSPTTWNRKLGILSYIKCHPTISDRNTGMYLDFFQIPLYSDCCHNCMSKRKLQTFTRFRDELQGTVQLHSHKRNDL